MTWEPRNKCSNSGDEDDSSDIEYVSNDNELNTTTVINENDDSRVNDNKRPDVKQLDDEMNGPTTDEQLLNRNKCDDSDSNTSSNLKQNSPSASFDNSSNYGKSDKWF